MPSSKKHNGNLWGLEHGAYSSTALAPRVDGLRRSLAARMGLRQAEMGWLAREQLDNYVRAKAKVLAVDAWLETHPVIGEAGEVAGPLKLYFTALNSSMRALESLRLVIGDLARTDDRYEQAYKALEAETR
jgi:hypothetical protein